MNPLYQKALNGTLASTSSGDPFDLTATNSTEVAVSLFGVNADASIYYYATLQPGESLTIQYFYVGQYDIIKTAATGAFMMVITDADCQSSGVMNIDCSMLTDPNDIGALPSPNSDVVIPVNSPSVLIGCGTLPSGNTVTREQYWRLLPASFSLAKGEKRTVSFTETAGLQQTSSSQESVSKSVSASASAGWGPVSASVSASLSATSTRMQQVSISTETTRYSSEEYDNTNGANSEVFFVWQLTDVYNIFDSSGEMQTSIVIGENPQLVSGPFDPDNLPTPPLRPALTDGNLKKALVSAAQ